MVLVKIFLFKKTRGKVNPLLWEISFKKGKNSKGKSPLMIGQSHDRQKSTAESSIRTSEKQMKGICTGPGTWLCNTRLMMIGISW